MPKLSKRPDSKYWFAWITNPQTKKRDRVSTHETNKRLAQGIADARERAVFDPSSAAKGPSITFEQASRDFLDQRAALKAKATLKFYEEKIGVLAHYFGTHRALATIEATAVDEFTAKRQKAGVTKSTIGKELTALRQVLKLARRQGKYPHALDTVLPERWEGQSKPKTRWCEPEEVWRIMAELPAHRAAVVAFHVATGSNLGEALRAQREDVSADKTKVYLRGTKRETRARTAPVFPWGLPFLEHALAHAEGKTGALLFRDWYKAMRWDLKRVTERLKVKSVSSNDLRRTYSQWLRQRGVEPALIGATMGHKDSRMVERVYGVIPADKLRPLIDRQLDGGKT